MASTEHSVDHPYTEWEVKTLFRYAHAHDVCESGRYDATARTIKGSGQSNVKMSAKL